MYDNNGSDIIFLQTIDKFLRYMQVNHNSNRYNVYSSGSVFHVHVDLIKYLQ